MVVNYWWSCAGNTRYCEGVDIAVCQQRTDGPSIQYNAGNVSPQLWFGVFNGAATQVSWRKNRQFLFSKIDFYLLG